MYGAYNWLDADNNYIHSVHKHGHGDFGYGQESTSHIEAAWGNLKSIIKNLYYSVPNSNFILFLHEEECRCSLSWFSDIKKWSEFMDVLNYIANMEINNLYNLDYLSSFTKRII